MMDRTTTPATNPHAAVYLSLIDQVAERAIARLDGEITSPSYGSFDRTWWCWKFTDFPASRFQEGIYFLAWLLTSTLAPARARGNARLLDLSEAALTFWSKLQHANGSFDEAYPFERSLAATGFTGYYVGGGIERLRPFLSASSVDRSLHTIEKSALWLAANGETHGVLSNHLAGAAAALQIAGDLLGTDRFRSARDRYLGIIYREQDPQEGWMREYGGADPGYQSHSMLYLADIMQRSRDGELQERLKKAAAFSAWFAHPDGSLGGEYASRGTKFALPAGFEMLASVSRDAASIAAHLRHSLANRRGVGGLQMDSWNLFPLLNNYLHAAEAAGDLSQAPALPWTTDGAKAVFPNAGLAVAHRHHRLLVCAPGLGGSLKLWNSQSNELVYEDCGYALRRKNGWVVSQTVSPWRRAASDNDGSMAFEIDCTFEGVSAIRFDPWRFLVFRLFTLTIGRLPSMARLLKFLLVAVLIRRKRPDPARLKRHINFGADGALSIADRISGLGAAAAPVGLDRHVPIHMGSARYADLTDTLGALVPASAPTFSGGQAQRNVTVPPEAG